jgi:glucokinase
MTIGVDLGGTHIRAGIEEHGTIIHPRKEAFQTRRSLEQTLDQFVEFIRPLVSAQVSGIGIGVPSVVDVERGIVYNVVNIPSWVEVPLKDILEDEFRIPVCINNDVNCFVLGEHRYGAVKGFRNVVGISCGTGLGSGIIINNQLYNGLNCGAGEIGLLHYLDHNIEYYASGNLFSTQFNTTAELAHQRALDGDDESKGYWSQFGIHLAEAIKSVVLTYDPEAIVLGGSLSKAFSLFSTAMHASLSNFPYPKSMQRLRIFQSTKENITLLGAAALPGQYVAQAVRE